MKLFLAVLTLSSCLALAACSQGPESPRGFSLPKGDAEAGKALFFDLGCNDCHSTADIEQIDPDNADIAFKLGGNRAVVTTYAELVTSIINPSHRLSNRFPEAKAALGAESRMRNYNEVMTVQQMVDLVTYLQPLYGIAPVSPTDYRPYHP